MVFYGPARYAEHARLILRALELAHRELVTLHSADISKRISAEHYPQGHRLAQGVVSDYTILFSYENLTGQSAEFRQYGMPHVMGYIEDMEHAFDLEFGFRGVLLIEGVGQCISRIVTAKIAPNPIVWESATSSAELEERTVEEYVRLGYRVPAGITHDKFRRRLGTHLCTLIVNECGLSAFTEALGAMKRDGWPLRKATSEEQAIGTFALYLEKATGERVVDLFRRHGVAMEPPPELRGPTTEEAP